MTETNSRNLSADKAKAVLRILAGHETVERTAGRLRAQEEQVIDWCHSFVCAGLHGLRTGGEITPPVDELIERQLTVEITELREALAEANAELALWEALHGLQETLDN
ncbi:hypothetical protein ACWC9T_37950 [Kitasatospora sp. NPDC001159]